MSTGSGTALAVGTATITAIDGAQTATLAVTVLDGSAITPSPSSLSLTAGGTATPFTVTCKKPDNTTDASPTYSATSSDTGIATVSQSGTTVTVTPVAAGSCTVNLSYTTTTTTATGSVALTVSAGAGTVTSVTPYYGSGAVNQGALVRVGASTTFTAKDQSGNPLDGTVGTWSSSDPTNVPVNASTGVCTPSGLPSADPVLTYTHTASGHTATIPLLVLPSSYTAFWADEGENYADTTDLRANVWGAAGNVPLATGGSGSKYNTASDEISHLSIDTTPVRLFMGRKTFLQEFPGGTGTPGGTLNANNFNKTRGWVWRAERIAPPGETGPNGTTAQFQVYSTSGSPSWAEKSGPGFDFSGANGRAEVGISGGTSGNVYGNRDWFIADANGQGPGVSAYGEPMTSGANTDCTTGGTWLFRAVLVEQRTRGLWSMRQYVAVFGVRPTWANNVQAEMASVNTILLHWGNGLSWNWNTRRDNGQYFLRSIGPWEVIDGETYGDPLGLLGSQPTPTLSSIDVNTIARGATSVTITLTGTGFNENCYPVFSNTGITVTPVSSNNATSNGAHLVRTGSTTFAVTVNCASGATPGAGTVKIYNAASQVSSATIAFTVT